MDTEPTSSSLSIVSRLAPNGVLIIDDLRTLAGGTGRQWMSTWQINLIKPLLKRQDYTGGLVNTGVSESRLATSSGLLCRLVTAQ